MKMVGLPVVVLVAQRLVSLSEHKAFSQDAFSLEGALLVDSLRTNLELSSPSIHSVPDTDRTVTLW